MFIICCRSLFHDELLQPDLSLPRYQNRYLFLHYIIKKETDPISIQRIKMRCCVLSPKNLDDDTNKLANGWHDELLKKRNGDEARFPVVYPQLATTSE